MSGPTFVSNRLAELPPEMNGPEGRAWATGLGSVQDEQLAVARVAALSRLPQFCPDDALDAVGQWLNQQRYLDEPNGTALPPTGYRGRLVQAFASWRIAGSSGAIIQALAAALGLTEGDITITGDIHWEGSWYTRFRTQIDTGGIVLTEDQRRMIRSIILKLKWAYSYPVDVTIIDGDTDPTFYIGPLIGAGLVIGRSTIGGFPDQVDLLF